MWWALLLDVDRPPAHPTEPCPYCGASVRFLTYSGDRKAVKDIARQFYSGDTSDDELDDVNVAEEAAGIEPGDDEGDTEGDTDRPDFEEDPEYAWERATTIVDGVPLRFAVRFKYGPYLSAASDETPEPPHMTPGDERMGRYFDRVGKRYAELVREDLQGVAPGFRPLTHPRHPAETGGPGIEFDVVPLIIISTGVVGAYPGLKALIKDSRRLLEHLKERTGEPGEIADAGIAYLFAAAALEAQLRPQGGAIDITFLSTSPLIKTVDVQETYGYLVNLLVDDELYVVAVGMDGRVASIDKTSKPKIDPPANAGVM